MDLQVLKGKRFAVVRASGTKLPDEMVRLFGPKSRVFDELSYQFLMEDGYEMFDVVLVWNFLDGVAENAISYTLRRFGEAARDAMIVRTNKEIVALTLSAMGFTESEGSKLYVKKNGIAESAEIDAETRRKSALMTDPT